MIDKCLIKNECDVCILITGDADFIPVFQIIKDSKKEAIISSVYVGFSQKFREGKFRYLILKRWDILNCLKVNKMTEIKKKTWPELFQKVLDGKKNSDVRLADFDIKEGDVLILEEYNPKTKEYTGRVIKKKVKNLTKLNLTDFNSFEDFKKYGHWLMEFE